ncbi:MAG TPA: hypothetical protein PKH24_16665 [Sedimentisphaerales bacterium]|jgi:hypothetical protein|nr:hypothetical protein [Sedimentisphaerales bacterium]HNU29238.1 hypothetical protein [Sedimentisphaerales bacterium]
MKKVWIVLIPMLALTTALQGEGGSPSGTTVDVVNQIGTSQSQNLSNTTIAEGGSSWNDNASTSNSQVDIDSTSISNYESRTSPLTSFPPYLPYWNHGGWGTVKAYFPNSPSANDAVYETTFDPESAEDMRELRGVLKALPYKGLVEVVGGVLNCAAVALFDAPNRYHHGRGLEIANSITRDRRPEGKPLLVFIDSNVDVSLLQEEGYAYVGKVSVDADVERNWDHAYKAAVAEALLWDADILLISGGMKGVTIGSNYTFPSAAAGYSQANYSLSLLGAKATGITEGKGKAVLSGDAYRFSPGKVDRRRIPESLYERIRARPQVVSQEVGMAPTVRPPAPLSRAASSPMSIPVERSSVQTPRAVEAPLAPQPEPQRVTPEGQVLPPPQSQGAERYDQAPPAITPQAPVQAEPASVCSVEPPAQVAQDLPGTVTATSRSENQRPGIKVRRELLAKAGLQDGRNVMFVTLR